MVGCIKDMRTCVDMEVCMCTGACQEVANRGNGAAVLAAALGKTGCCMQRRQDLEYMVHVYECGCKDLGEDSCAWCCWVLLGRVASAVMAQDCAGVVELSAAGV